MKWRLSVHGAIVVMAIGVSSVAVAQPRANDGTTLAQLAAIRVTPERAAGFRQSLFTGTVSQSVPPAKHGSRVHGRGMRQSERVL